MSCFLGIKLMLLLLQEGATLRPQAAAVLKEMAQVAQVYLIAHVVDDVGEATVRWAQGLCWEGCSGCRGI